MAISAVEHKSVMNPAVCLIELGWQIAYIPCNQAGEILPAALESTLTAPTQLVAIQFANNETGVIHPLAKLVPIAKQHGALFFCDAVQAAGKVRVDFSQLDVDFLSLSAHKLGGPQGVGALIARDFSLLNAVIDGGGQEQNLRSGTYNVAGIVGFGKAAELATQELTQRHYAMLMCQHHLEEQLINFPNITILGANAKRLPNTTFITVADMDSEMLIMALDKAGIAVSGGAACGENQPSHVAQAMQVDEALAHNVLRISFGPQNTQEEVDKLIAALKRLL
jgi:cysteine desulfurase